MLNITTWRRFGNAMRCIAVLQYATYLATEVFTKFKYFSAVAKNILSPSHNIRRFGKLKQLVKISHIAGRSE